MIIKYYDLFISSFFIIHCIFWFVIMFVVVGITVNRQYLLEDIYYTQWSLYNLNHYFMAKDMNWFMYLIPFIFSIISMQICYIFYKEQCEQKTNEVISFYEWLTKNWKSAIKS